MSLELARPLKGNRVPRDECTVTGCGVQLFRVCRELEIQDGILVPLEDPDVLRGVALLLSLADGEDLPEVDQSIMARRCDVLAVMRELQSLYLTLMAYKLSGLVCRFLCLLGDCDLSVRLLLVDC